MGRHHRVQDLAHDAVGHIRANRRSEEEVKLLQLALQLFHEGTLGSVEPKGMSPKASREEILIFCDTPVEQLGLAGDAVRQVKLDGYRLGGELFGTTWDPDTVTGSRVRRLMRNLGVSFGFDPYGFGWHPKYWEDLVVHNALNASIFTIDSLNVWDPLHCFSLGSMPHLVGDFIEGVQNGRYSVAREQWSQARWNLGDRYPMLHMHMRLPEGWRLQEQCPEYMEGLEVRKRAHAFCEAIGRPVRRDEYCPDWEGDPLERRAQLAHALVREKMNPHFFSLVALWGLWPNVGTRSSVRSLLLGGTKEPVDGRYQELFWNDWVAEAMLKHWGLRFKMRADEVDTIFGAEAA